MYDHIYIKILKCEVMVTKLDQRSLETGALSRDAHQLGENVSMEIHWIEFLNWIMAMVVQI